MTKVLRSWSAMALLSTATMVAACSPSTRGADDDDVGDDAPPSVDAGAPDAHDIGFIDAAPDVPDSSTPSEIDGVVYGHSSSTLYKVDPDSFAVTSVADFSWPAESGFDTMTDIAVDKDGHMMGVSFTKIYRVDPMTAACTFVGPLDHEFNGLSFVPAGEGDPGTDERLVGTTLDGSVWKIDPATGATTQVGSYGDSGGTTWTSSGDIVYVEGFGIVATVKGGGLGHDFLASIDPMTFRATPIGALGVGTGYSDIWGLGFWKGKVFGFSGAGQMLLIEPTTGVASLLNGAQSVLWWGAGVTTSAPIIP
jgi:hypothetical protein